jgi:CxxC-x17-CxxC domain-containing protein
LTALVAYEIVALLQVESRFERHCIIAVEDRYMAANILHFGQELSYCFPFLRKAGYSINRYERVFDFRQALRAVGHDAVSLCDTEEDVSRVVVQTARNYSSAPLILFRKGRVIPFLADDRERVRKQENVRSDFDLDIPADTSPWMWISEIDRLIARSRQVINEAQRTREMSVVLRREAAAASDKSRFERERGELERARNSAMVIAAAIPVDRVLTCADCGAEFVFTAGEQLFFRLRNFVNDPKHCKSCRSIRRTGTPSPPRKETAVTCAECGILTTVPFKPFRGQPVLCRACFDKSRSIV